MRIIRPVALVALTLSTATAQRRLRANDEMRKLDAAQPAAPTEAAKEPQAFILEETVNLMGKQVKGAVSSSGWYFAPGSGQGQGGDGNKEATRMFQLDEKLVVEKDGVKATVDTTQLFYPKGLNQEHQGQEGILVKETLHLQKGTAEKAVSSSGWYYTGGSGGAGSGGDGNKDLALKESMVVDGQQIDAAVASSGWYYTGGSGGAGSGGDGNKVEIDESVTIGKQTMKGSVAASGWYFSEEAEHADSGKHKLEVDESMSMEEEGIKAAVSSSGWYFAPGQGGGQGGDGGRRA